MYGAHLRAGICVVDLPGKPVRYRSLSLSARSAKLYHLGMRSPVTRATSVDANERRDWRVYAEFAQRLIAQARKLCAEGELGLDLSNQLKHIDYSPDSSVSNQ